jgi:hypothetical protein
MTRKHQLQMGALLALIPCCAWASEPTGTVTVLYGIPGLVLANGLALLFRALSPTPLRQLAIKIIYYPLLFATAVVALDAIASAISRGWQWVVACTLYFGLAALLLYLLRTLLVPSTPGET